MADFLPQIIVVDIREENKIDKIPEFCLLLFYASYSSPVRNLTQNSLPTAVCVVLCAVELSIKINR